MPEYIITSSFANSRRETIAAQMKSDPDSTPDLITNYIKIPSLAKQRRDAC